MLFPTFNELAQLPCPELKDPDTILANFALTYEHGDQKQAIQACIDNAFGETALSNRSLDADVEYTPYGCPRLSPNSDLKRILSMTQAKPFITFTHEDDMSVVWMLITSGKSSITGTGIDYVTNKRAALAFEDCTEEELPYLFFSEELQNHADQLEPTAYYGALACMKEAAFKALSQAYSFSSRKTPSNECNFIDMKIEILAHRGAIIQFEAHPRRSLERLTAELGATRITGTCTPHANGHLAQAYMTRR